MKNIIIILLFSFFSCTPSTDSIIKKKLNELHNSKLIIDDTLTYFNLEKGVHKKIFQKQNQIVTYINGDCSDCIYSLVEWDNFINGDSIKPFNYTFFLYTSDIEHFKHLLTELEVNLNFVYDPNDKYLTNNKLTENPVLNTFYIDNLNTVKIVGSPIINNKIEELYLEQTEVK